MLKQLVAYVGLDNFLAGAAPLLRPARLVQRDPGRPAGAAGGRVRAGPGRLVQAVAGDRRREHAAARVHAGRGRHVHRVRGPAGGPRGAPGAARPPDRDRALRPDPGWPGPPRAGWRPTSAANGPWWPSWPARPRPTWCWSTTTTSPTPRSAWTRTPWPRCWPASASSPSRCPPRCAGPPPGTCAGTRELAARDYVRLVLARDRARSPTSRWRRRCCARPTCRAAPLRRPGVAGDRARRWPPARCGSCWTGPSRAPMSSLPTRRRSSAWRSRPVTWRCWPGCWTARVTVDGLAVDTELRWRLLRRLVSRGAAGRGRDRGRAGPGRHRRGRPPGGRLPRRDSRPPRPRRRPGSRSSAARCPTPRSARCSPGSTDADQLALLAPYEERYFDVVPASGATGVRHGPVVRVVRLPDGGHPAGDRGDHRASSTRTGPPPGLVRLLVEGRDGLRRALRCQERDRQAEG